MLGIYDVLSAIIAQECGMPILWASSFCRSAVRGLPDSGLLSHTDLLEFAERLRTKVPTPVLFDCDNAGDSLDSAQSLAAKLAVIGANAVCIEDKANPKTSSLYPGPQRLRPVSDQCAFLRTMKVGLGDDGFLVARTEVADDVRSVPESLARLFAYKDAGASAVMAQTSSSQATVILKLASEWNDALPLFIAPTTYSIHPRVASEHRIAAMIFANQLLRSMVAAQQEFCHTLSATGLPPPEEPGSLDHLISLTQRQ